MDGKVILCNKVLKSHRRRLCLSQEELVACCSEIQVSVSIATIKRAESGKQVNYNTARKLAIFYGVDTEDLIAKDNSVLTQINHTMTLRAKKNLETGKAKLTADSPKGNGAGSVVEKNMDVLFAEQQLTAILDSSRTYNRSRLAWVFGGTKAVKTHLLKNLYRLSINRGCDSHFLPVNALGFKNSLNITQAIIQEYNAKNYSDNHSDYISIRNLNSKNKNSCVTLQNTLVFCFDDVRDGKNLMQRLLCSSSPCSERSILYVLSSSLAGSKFIDEDVTKYNFPITSIFLPS